jgi:predicted transcriptional regulator
MKLTKDNKQINENTLVMQAAIFQPILIACMTDMTFSDLSSAICRTLPISKVLIKKYLFYLIENELISYNGKKRVYTTNVKGIHLLFRIELKKFNERLNLDDILLYVE